MTLTCSYNEKYATGRAIFTDLVHLKYSLNQVCRICLRTDIFKINYCLNILFIIWFLHVFYSITFVLRNTDPTQRDRICSFADKQLKLMLSLGESLYSYAVCFVTNHDRRFWRVFLGLYRANREISNKTFVYIFLFSDR